MFDKVTFSSEAQAYRLMFNLNDKYRDKVVNLMPKTLDDAISSALWFEDHAEGLSPNNDDLTSVHHDGTKQSGVAQALDRCANAHRQDVHMLTEQISKLAVQLGRQRTEPRGRQSITHRDYMAAQPHRQWQDDAPAHMLHHSPYPPQENLAGLVAAERSDYAPGARRVIMRAETYLEQVTAASPSCLNTTHRSAAVTVANSHSLAITATALSGVSALQWQHDAIYALHGIQLMYIMTTAALHWFILDQAFMLADHPSGVNMCTQVNVWEHIPTWTCINLKTLVCNSLCCITWHVCMTPTYSPGLTSEGRTLVTSCDDCKLRNRPARHHDRKA